MRLGPVPHQGALRRADEELSADLYQRLHLPGQDHVPGVQPERQGFRQPGAGLHGRGAPPRHLPQAGDLPPGGLALRAEAGPG